MKRRAVIKKLKDQARLQGKTFEVYELTNHSGIKIGNTAATLGRHGEIDEVTVQKFFKQFSNELGKDWYKK